MSQRNVRVNELLRREISDVLHTRFRQESVYITITAVNVTPDHRTAQVFFSVLGSRQDSRQAHSWLAQNCREIRHQVGKRIVLKYLPHLRFEYDPSIERGANIIQILDNIQDDSLEEHDDENHPPGSG